MLKTQSSTPLKFLLSVLLCLGTVVIAQAQISIAPMQRLGDRITCFVGGSKFELTPNRKLIHQLQFAPTDAETQKVFDEVEPYTNLRTHIYTIPVEESINVQICPSNNGMNYIAFSADWLQKIYDQTSSNWALYGIIAHEIGHYALNHDRTRVRSDPQIELEADRYAGEILAQMGASQDEAQAAYNSDLMRYQDSDTHPPIKERLAAVREGWRKGHRASSVDVAGESESSTECSAGIGRGYESATTYYLGGAHDEYKFKFKVKTVQFNARDDLRATASKLTDTPGTYKWNNQMYYWSKSNAEDRLLLAWTNATTSTFGWVVVESVGDRWYYKSNADADWTRLERGATKTKIWWDSSGQTIEVLLYVPNLTQGWTTNDIQYGFGYSN